ncbi:MAG: type IV pilin protein [Wenzhouxiangellaceae bacterium]|nr:type IV pilin protein [Wenzhouxiangellaceae bacterium]
MKKLRGSSTRPRVSGGFTLIELMVAVAILAIIMGIAIPSYSQWVLKSGRAEAKGALMQGAQALERCFTRFSAYNDGKCDAAKADPTGIDGRLSENDKYRVTVTAIAANTFTLTAAPNGGQIKDTECGSFTLTHTGARDVSATGNSDKCW